jgi:hypothetical protein
LAVLLTWSLLPRRLRSLLHWMTLLLATFLAALAGCVRIKRTSTASEDGLRLALHIWLAWVRDRLRCIRSAPLTPRDVGLSYLRLLNLRLLDIRPAGFSSRNVWLTNLWLLNIRTASFRSREIGLLDLRLRTLGAPAIGVNPRILGIHAAANYFVVRMRSARRYRHGAGASIGSLTIGSGTPHVVVIHAAVHAVVAV